MKASAPPGSVRWRVRKIVPPLSRARPRGVVDRQDHGLRRRADLGERVRRDGVDRVGLGGSGARPDREMPGTPGATNGAWLPELVGTARRSTCVGRPAVRHPC